MSWDDLGSLGQEIQILVEGSTREEVQGLAERFQDLAVAGPKGIAFPVRSGRFRASLDFYVGSPPSGEGQSPDQPFYPPPGHDQIAAGMQHWQPGKEAGFVDQVPYAGNLADGSSPQWPAGSLDRLVEEAARK